MDHQSPIVTSTGFRHDDPDTPEEYPELDKKTLEDLDVLDLTKGAGEFGHPPFKVSFPPHENDVDEDDKSWTDSLEPSPEEEQPSSISWRTYEPVVPSAPVEEEVRPVVPRRGSSGSADENLFPLPAASVPLMHSSADKVLDLQQPSSTGHEDFASLLGFTASLPSISPLSADFSKEHVVATETFHGSFSNTYTRTVGDLSLVENLGNVKEPAFSEVATGREQPSLLGHNMEDVIFSEKGNVVEHPTSQQETVAEEQTKLYTQSAKELFSGMLKSVGPPNEEFSEIREGTDEQYVDFKPFMSTKPSDLDFASKAVAEKVNSDVDSQKLRSPGQLKEVYIEEKEIDLSDDISPVTPEIVPDSSNYEMFSDLEQHIPFSVGLGQVSGNKTDEKKMAEIEAQAASQHFGSNVAMVNPFFEHVDQEVDYVTTQNVSAASPDQAANKSEGLTPDIVQEAYESEAHDIAVSNLCPEPKIDLVQTAAESVEYKISPTKQSSALFEDSESVSSPVLPDIVMEAPLASSTIAFETIHSQPDVSPVGNAPVVSEERIKYESEKPPSYEEAINKPVPQAKDTFVTSIEPRKGPTGIEAEAPYISIACDLIKETIATEPTPPHFTDFSKVLKHEFDAQFTQQLDDSSPESEQSEPSYKHWEPEIITKEISGIMAESVKDQINVSKKELERDQELREPSTTKAYLESFQLDSSIPKDASDILAESLVSESIKVEKPLQMDEFEKTLYTDKVSKYSPNSETSGYESRSSTIPFAEAYGFKPFNDAQGEVGQKALQIDNQISSKKSSSEKKQEQSSELFQDFTSFQNEHTEGYYESEKSDDFDIAESGAYGKDVMPKGESLIVDEIVAKPVTPTKDADINPPFSKGKEARDYSVAACSYKKSVIDLLYWQDIKKTGVVFGLSLFLLLSLTAFSIVSVCAYVALALLSVTISFRIYKGVLQAIQKSDDGHPFKCFLDSNVAVSEELVQKYCNVALNHINCTLKELRRLFLVEDLVDSLKFAVLMWVFTYIGALFNGLTLLILALISLFSIPVIYERHQTQIDRYLSLVNKNVKDTTDLVLSKIPGLKRKTE
ncbi:reticulon-4 [Bombina bombina]|uniref:reticulon-4 n=1 Tax=Bombina bombina TaxID=8345 RepID=UPI00235AFA82|nr:reticulon-4 [Bombina bombina]